MQNALALMTTVKEGFCHRVFTPLLLLSAGFCWFQILHEREKKLCKLDSLMTASRKPPNGLTEDCQMNVCQWIEITLLVQDFRQQKKLAASNLALQAFKRFKGT